MKAAVNPQISPGWKKALEEEFRQPYFAALKSFLLEERKKYSVYPPGPQIFSAFNATDFEDVKVVMLGQDPYHGPGQAHGLCFSVPPGIRKPPSLQNILKELREDLGIAIPEHGSLVPWAEQGVLLLNATLTVRANTAGSHQKKGWERFTDKAIYKLARERENLVFMLWGRFAQAKKVLIDPEKHCILEAAHPSPLSAHNGFFGCRHFSRANAYLKQSGKEAVNWQL